MALDEIADALSRGEPVKLRSFGSFSVRSKRERIGRNPRSGEAVQVPSKRVPHFKPGKALREAVDQKSPLSAQAADDKTGAQE